MAPESKQIRTLLLIAGAVLICDFVSKELAVALLWGKMGRFLDGIPHGFNFIITMNTGTAGGASLGDHTRLINILSMCAVAAPCILLARPLSLTHRLSPIAFGLILGAALGNTLSLLMRPGVVDFLGYRAAGGQLIIFNLADVAVVVGIALLIPIALSMASRVTWGGSTPGDAGARDSAKIRRRIYFEEEVPIMVASEVRRTGDKSEVARDDARISPRRSGEMHAGEVPGHQG